MMSVQKSHSTLQGLNNSLKHPSFIATQINENMEANNQCRICLQSQQQSFPRTLIKPCKCSGSVSYVHQECIKKWLEATLSKKTFRERLIAFEKGVACEMCKQMIKFQVIIEKSFNDCAQIRRLIVIKITLFLMLIFLILASSIGTILSLYYIAYNSQILQQKGINLMILILSICGALFSILFFGVATFLLVQQYLIKQRTEIHRVKKFSTIRTRQSYAKNKIVPMDDQQNQTMQMISMVQ